jgi:hypothetical protein
MIEHLHRLDPQPYQYGSHIGFEYFPRPNDLFRFAEFAVANYAAGLVEPKRFATIRLKNRYRGIGLVADISDREVRPERDALSSSHHVEALVEHMRGRVVNGLTTEPRMTITAAAGNLDIPVSGPATLEAADHVAEVMVPLPADETLRCYYLGVLASLPASMSVTASVERTDGSRGAPVKLELPAASSVAAVVEVEPEPQPGAGMWLRFEGGAEAIVLYDLFVIATG